MTTLKTSGLSLDAIIARMTPNQRVVSLACFISMTTLLFGWDTGSIHSQLGMEAFKRDIADLEPLPEGVVVATILMSSTVSGTFAGAISDRLSRKYTIILGDLFFAVGCTIEAAAPNLGVLCFGRVLAGIGEGLWLGVVGTYVAEISPKRLRSHLVLVIGINITVGLAVAFFFAFGCSQLYPSTLSWRLPFIVAAVFATLMAIGTYKCPFSPRWLLTHGRRDEAEQVLSLLIGTEPEQHAEREELISAGTSGTQARASLSDGLRAMWSRKYVSRTSLGIFINVAQQLSGIDFVLFYAPLLFKQAGFDPNVASFVASGATGFAQVIVVTLALFYINTVGRRTLFIIGGVSIGVSQGIIGCMYATGAATTPAGKWVILACILLYVMCYGGCWAATARLFSTEIQAGRTRAAASSFANAANQASNTIVALTGPDFLARSASAPYFTYGGISAFAALIGWLAMPETLGKSLEDIDHKLEPPRVVRWSNAIRARGDESQGHELRQRRGSSRIRKLSAASGEAFQRAELRRHMQRLDSDSAIVDEAVS